jgi:MFS family permease
LVATNAVAAFTAALTAFLVMTDLIQYWHALVLCFVVGTANSFDAPIRLSFVSELVGQDDLPNAVSLNSSSFNIARLIGPAASGILIYRFGTGPSFLINAVSTMFVIGALLSLRTSELHLSEQPAVRGSIKQGWMYLWARPDLRAVLLVALFTSAFGLNFNFFNAIMVTQVLNENAAVFGTLGTVVAVGSLSGALLSTRIEHLRTPRNIMLGAITFGCLLIAISATPNLYIYASILPFAGIIVLMTMISANSSMQTHTDPAIRGRVMAWYVMAFNAPFGQPLLGWISEELGPRWAVAFGGAMTALAAVVIALIFRGRLGRPTDFSVASVTQAIGRV